MRASRYVLSSSLLVVTAALGAALLSGCQPQGTASPTAGSRLVSPSAAASPIGWPRTITDDTGASITLSAPPQKIVSLAPSNTEVLFAIGVGDRVVADTQSCDYPPEAKNRPHIGGMSAGDLERIQVALPDLVVAVGSINQKLIAALRAAHIPTLAVQPRTTDDVLATVRLIGKATGQDTEAERLAADVKARIDKVRSVTASAPSRPKTLIVYGANPIYTSPPDSYIHDLIGVAGGTDIVQTPLPQNIISPAVVIERAPDVIICAPALREKLKALPGWAIVPAVKTDRFFATTGTAELTRPGPRLAEAVEQLARYLHPDLFPPSAASGKQ